MATISSDGNANLPSKTKKNTNVSGRTGGVPYSKLWFDDKGNRLPIKYILDTSMEPKHRKSYEGMVKAWTDKTCLKFQKVDASAFMNNITEWCFKEKVKRKEDRMLFIEHDGSGNAGYGVSAEGERCLYYFFLSDPPWKKHILYAYTLGLIEDFNRPDYKKFVGLNFEHFSFAGEATSQLYLNHIMQCRGKSIPMAVPFDYMSILMMGSNWYGTTETTPVIVTLDPSQQYLLDYRRRGQLPESFYDVLTANILYKCIPEWESSCKTSGKEVPKCQNYGYVTKKCTCLCSPSYSGKTCDKRIGDNFPYPTQDGAHNIVIIDHKNYDLGKLLSIKTASAPGAVEDLKYNVFINVKIQPKDPKRLPTIKIFLPFKKVGALLVGKVDKFIEELDSLDCEKGMRLLWGNSKRDGRRLACECTSMLGSNEPVESSRVIRGREPNMTITLVNQFGLAFKSEQLTVESSKLHLLAEFHAPPKLMFKQNATSPPIPEGGTGGDDTSPVNSAKAAAMTAAGGSGATTAVVAAGAGLLMLLLLCLLLFFLKRRKKKKQGKLGEEEEEEEEDHSGSGSDSDDEN